MGITSTPFTEAERRVKSALTRRFMGADELAAATGLTPDEALAAARELVARGHAETHFVPRLEGLWFRAAWRVTATNAQSLSA